MDENNARKGRGLQNIETNSLVVITDLYDAAIYPDLFGGCSTY
jgi:hypothetical protein